MVMLGCPVAPRKSGQVLFLDVCILGWVVLMNRKVFPGVFCLFFKNILHCVQVKDEIGLQRLLYT